MSSTKACKLGVNMLTSMITTLSSISPLERRSSNKCYSLHVKDYFSVRQVECKISIHKCYIAIFSREWGRPYKISDVKVSWYVPGQIEIDKVRLLINTYLLPVLEKLSDYSCGKNTLTRPQLRNFLKIINAVMSAHVYLPMWDEPAISL